MNKSEYKNEWERYFLEENGKKLIFAFPIESRKGANNVQ